MADVWFYQIEDTTPAAVDAAAARLLEKVLSSGNRAVVQCPSVQRAERVNDALWTYEAGSFLPHGSAAEGSPSLQPIYVTAGDENPNEAAMLLVIGGGNREDAEASEDADSFLRTYSGYTRVLDLFEGTETQRTAARIRWKKLKEAGHSIAYYALEGGKWVKKA